VFVTGTDTGVGKTYVGAAVISELASLGTTVVPRKPIESGCSLVDRELLPTDAKTLHDAAGGAGALHQVCPYRLRWPLSPERAARLEGLRVTIDDLARACLANLVADCFLWVEGAGGFYSPLAVDGLNADLAATLGLPVLLVAADRLGCINHVLLTADAIYARRSRLVAVVLNRLAATSASGMNNAEDLGKRLDCPLIEVGYGNGESPNRSQWTELSHLLSHRLHDPGGARA
jgi:dethiobiotin synthetase